MARPLEASSASPTASESRRREQYRVKRIKLPAGDDGKRPSTSLVIDNLTGAPARIAMRWGIRRRAEGLSPKSLYQYNATIAWIYEWFACSPDSPAGDLDEFFTDGRVLTKKQINSLVHWIDTKGRPELIARIGGGFKLTVSEPEVIVPKLDTMSDFLMFALDPAQRKGRPCRGDLARARHILKREIRKRRQHIKVKERKTEGGRLTDEQVKAVRAKIGWKGGNPLTNLWAPCVAMRNWLIFEVAFETGFRVSELAALTRSSLPQFSDQIKLDPDPQAEWDDRLEEAGSKTFGRLIPVTDDLLFLLSEYVEASHKPWGRRAKRGIEALWTRSDGGPLSVRMIEKVFEQISRAVGFRVTAHRLRHGYIYETLGTTSDLRAVIELSGHSSVEGLKPYMRERLHEQAAEIQRNAYKHVRRELDSMPSEVL